MISTQIKKNVIELIANTQTDKAIDILYQERDKNDFTIVVLQNRWKELKKDKITGIVSESEYNVERNTINKSILDYLSNVDKEIEVNSFESKYGNSSVLFSRSQSPTEITIQDAISICRYRLAFHGITLVGLFIGLNNKKLIQKIKEKEFQELILVIANPKKINKNSKVYSQIMYSLGQSQIGDLLNLNNENSEKVTLYVTDEFIRYSATYIDCGTFSEGLIRVNFPLYGLDMEETPMSIIKEQNSNSLYQSFINSAEVLYKRARKPFRRFSEVENFLNSND